MQVLKFSVQDPVGWKPGEFLVLRVLALVLGFDVRLFESWVVTFYNFHAIELKFLLLVSYFVLGVGSR